MSVVGLDFGSVNSVVALARRKGIDVVLNTESKRETPAMVNFGDKQVRLRARSIATALSLFPNRRGRRRLRQASSRSEIARRRRRRPASRRGFGRDEPRREWRYRVKVARGGERAALARCASPRPRARSAADPPAPTAPVCRRRPLPPFFTRTQRGHPG